MSNEVKENKVQQVIVKRRPGTDVMIYPTIVEAFEEWMRKVNAHEVYEVYYAR